MTSNVDALTQDQAPLSHESFKIALFYCYVEIHNVQECVMVQNELCTNLMGRIRVSPEGLNGVLSGQDSHLKAYQQQTQQYFGLVEEMDVKYCSLRTDLPVEAQLFTNLIIRETKEVVTLFDSPTNIADKNQGIDYSSKKYYRRRRRNRTKCEPQMDDQADHEHSKIIRFNGNNDVMPAPHLSPKEWNERLLSHCDEDAIVLDARNVYESRVGHFRVEGIPTLLTNTRKYTSLPAVLLQSKEQLAGKVVYMFCTGGVRCERASAYLQSLSTSEDWKGLEPPKGIYQLEGGIQRYLETFGSTAGMQHEHCLYKGKNFVFDQRRTDPCVGTGVVGNCIICRTVWDDYDNGFAPADNHESRCCKCRMLVLICSSCRPTVRSWSEPNNEGKPDIYCGLDDCINEGECVTQAEMLI